MPVERRRVAQDGVEPGLGGHGLAEPGEAVQAGSAAGRVPGRHVGLLPAQDLGPGALVDGVVDGHHGLHVGGAGGVVALALHGVEEHLLRRVDPVAARRGARLLLVVDGARRRTGGGRAGDGRDHARGAQSGGIVLLRVRAGGAAAAAAAATATRGGERDAPAAGPAAGPALGPRPRRGSGRGIGWLLRAVRCWCCAGVSLVGRHRRRRCRSRRHRAGLAHPGLAGLVVDGALGLLVGRVGGAAAAAHGCFGVVLVVVFAFLAADENSV